MTFGDMPFLFFLLFFNDLTVCILVILTSSWYRVVAEAGCIRYHLCINILPFIEKPRVWLLSRTQIYCGDTHRAATKASSWSSLDHLCHVRRPCRLLHDWTPRHLTSPSSQPSPPIIPPSIGNGGAPVLEEELQWAVVDYVDVIFFCGGNFLWE